MGNKIEMISKEEWNKEKTKKRRKRKLNKTFKGIFSVIILLLLSVVIVEFLIIKKREYNQEQKQKAVYEEIALQREKKERIETNAVTASKITVQKSLKSPSTAKFPDSAFQAEEYKKTLVKDGSDNQIWYIQSYVDSQNSFGAMVRAYWAVKIQMYEDETYTILDVDIE